MDPNRYFAKLLAIEPYYEAEHVFFPAFWDFAYRFQSLQRHWELNKGFLQSHFELLRKVPDDSSAELADARSETVDVDAEYFFEYVRLSTLSISLSLVENMLGQLSEEVAKDRGKEVQLDTRPLPYIDKHILWLTRGCGLEIVLPKEVRKRLDVLRALRNRFVHRIDRDLPMDIQNVFGKMLKEVGIEGRTVTDDFIDLSLRQIADLVKRVELAYISYSGTADA